MSHKTVIIIAGPTAVGKTAAAIKLAQHFNTEIISADSRQCFKELKIGVARPSEEELSTVPHHFIATHSIHQKVTAATFEQYALEKAEHIFKRRDVAIMVGGTGLYIKAFCDGMDSIPEIPESIRRGLINSYELYGLEWLQQQLKKRDPHFYQTGEIQNPQRSMRALEVVMATGQSINSFKKGVPVTRPFNIIKLALNIEREKLYHQINNRVDKMIQEGLLDEVTSLLPYQQLNALQTVGYKELFPYLNGTITLNEAVAEIKKNTRRYAKRQVTWFRGDAQYTWLHPDAVMDAIPHIEALRYK